MDDLTAPYAQLFGVGIFWITLHCSGMCGPIMAGLTLGTAEGGKSRLRRALEGLHRVLAYQAGRALMYATLGALAGAAGAVLQSAIEGVARVAGLVVAVGLVVAGLSRTSWARRLWARPEEPGGGGAQLAGRFLGGVLRHLHRGGGPPGLLRMIALGFVMGLLPCMLMFWVLSLAASTAHVGHGAALMVLLVVLTTPLLAIAGVVPHLVGPRGRRIGELAMPWMMALSGVWLGLIAAAANGWIEHVHISFQMGGEPYAVMFW